MDARRFDPEWQERRLELMRHFTAPSIASQTDPNFSWYVFVQVGTPEAVEAEITKMGAHVVHVDTDDVDAAQKLVRARRGMVATVNLDTDDAIVPSFLERVRAEAKPKNEIFVFLRGYRYRPVPPNACSTKSRTNPFNTRVETKAQDAETVFALHHGKIDRVIDNGKPMWLQVIHGDNISNRSLKTTRRDVKQHNSRWVVTVG